MVSAQGKGTPMVILQTVPFLATPACRVDVAALVAVALADRPADGRRDLARRG